jgi:hypothetical protein
MKMEPKYVLRRRISVVIVFILILSLFTYATRDVCYVGKDGNWLGYGSCSKMMDNVIGEANK